MKVGDLVWNRHHGFVGVIMQDAGYLQCWSVWYDGELWSCWESDMEVINESR